MTGWQEALGDGNKEMYKVGGKVRKLLGMWVCGSGEMMLERKILDCQHGGGN